MPAWKVLSTLRRPIIFEFESSNGCILSQDTSILLENEECFLVGEQCRAVVRSLAPESDCLDLRTHYYTCHLVQSSYPHFLFCKMES